MVPLLAQEGAGQPAAAPQQGGPLGMVFFIVAMMAIWWFLVLGPQRKADKARRAKLDAIKKGDRVRTRGGIEGVVARVQDDTVYVRIDVDGKVQVAIAKPYVDDVLTEESAPAEEKK
jgi:preprotein translocase subunit YajC